MNDKPTIIVTSSNDDDTFRWQSDGWYMEHQRNTESAKLLFAKARRAIKAGSDVPDTIKKLEQAGFRVERAN